MRPGPETFARPCPCFSMLIAIKLFHTIVWMLLAGCVLALPIVAARRRFRGVVILSGIILVECAVIGLNHGRCPLTDLAARFTANRADNLDIYLFLWLAHYNKTIFGILFVMGEFFAVGRWRKARTGPPTANRPAFQKS